MTRKEARNPPAKDWINIVSFGFSIIIVGLFGQSPMFSQEVRVFSMAVQQIVVDKRV
jgi:hypothetical protein